MDVDDRTNRGNMNHAATAPPDVAAAVAESAIEFKALLEQAAVGVTKTEIATGKYVFVNQRFADIVGYTREELLKMSFHDITDPADLATDLSNEQLLIAGTLHEYAMEKRYIRKDGTAIWVRRAVSPLELPGETPRHVISIIEDITDRKRAEDALRESEEKFRDVFELSPLGKTITQIDGTLHVNKAFADMLGYSQEELETANWRDLTHPDDLQKSTELVASLLSGKADQMSMEKRYIHKSGRVVWTEVITFLARDASGKPKFFLTSIQDITQRRQADEALRTSEARFKTMFDEAPLGIALADSRTGHLSSVNAMFAKIAGRTVEEMADIDWMSITHPDDVQKDLDNMALLNAGKISRFQMEKRYLRPDGTHVWINMTIAPVYAEDKAHPRHLCMIEDITDRKKAEEEVRTLNAELEERVRRRTAELEAANRELEAFSYSVSHDLRAPLRSIDGFSQAAIEDSGGVLPELARQDLERVRLASQRMGQLIDDMLLLSRVTRSEMHVQQVDMTELARDAASDLISSNPGRVVQLDVEPGMTAMGDPRLLHIVFANLLDNAWKFTSRHEHAHVVVGTVEDPDHGHAFFVRDDGAGFDPRYASKLFVAFQRLHSLEEFPGTGIGLATVWRAVRRHGGSTWAEGEIDHGATFYFTIPDLHTPILNKEE